MKITQSQPAASLGFSVIFPVILGLVAVLLASTPHVFGENVSDQVFAEGGLIETLSGIMWFLTALVALSNLGASKLRALVFTIGFAAFGAREFDLHKAFTSDSILKTNFYETGSGLEVVFGGIAAVLIIIALISMVVLTFKFLWSARKTRPVSAQLLFYGWGILVAGKVMDRLPSVLRKKFELELPSIQQSMLKAAEEGLELLVPVMMFVSFILVPNAVRRSDSEK